MNKAAAAGLRFAPPLRPHDVRNNEMDFPIKSGEQLKTAFGLDNSQNYEEFIAFTDRKPGFSIKRPYPDDIPFIAPVTKNGKPDTVAMIRVLYNPNNLAIEQLDKDKVPLWINIGAFNKYSYHHFGYDYEHEDCPTAESLEQSQKSPRPISLTFNNNFFYSHQGGNFLSNADKKMSGIEVLEAVFQEHCNTTRETRRRKWKLIALIGALSDHMIHALVVLLRILFRKKFDESRNPFQPYLERRCGTAGSKIFSDIWLRDNKEYNTDICGYRSDHILHLLFIRFDPMAIF